MVRDKMNLLCNYFLGVIPVQFGRIFDSQSKF